MAKRRKSRRTPRRHKNPIARTAKKTHRRSYRRSNPSVKGMLGMLQEPIGMGIGMTLPEKILDMVGIPRYVIDKDKDGKEKGTYSKNWFRALVTGTAGYFISSHVKNGLLSSFGKGMLAKGAADLMDGLMFESSEYRQAVAGALKSSTNKDVSSMVKKSVFGLEGLGNANNTLRYNPYEGRVLDTMPNYSPFTPAVSGVAGDPYFKI